MKNKNNNDNIVHLYNAPNDALSANRIHIIYTLKMTILYTHNYNCTRHKILPDLPVPHEKKIKSQ